MTPIPEIEIARLKRDTDLAELVRSSGVVLSRKGRGLMGRCPFHADRTPSLVVTPDKNLWHCLGACREGGSVFDWVMRRDGVNFRRAVETLRELNGGGRTKGSTGMTVKSANQETTPGIDPENAEEQRLIRWVLEEYHKSFQSSQRALKYFESRGIRDAETVQHFRVGYADGSLPGKLPPFKTDHGRETRDVLMRAGFLLKSGHERFKGSVVFPFFDEEGRISGVYGRRVKEGLLKDARHYYLPGPRRGLFNRGLLDAESVILCEGVFDMLSFFANGYRNVTATHGTEGFGGELLELLKKKAVSRVFLAFDRDAAGDAAAEAVGAELRDAGIETLRVLFPRGMDANDFCRKTSPAKEALRVLLKGAEWTGKGADAPEQEEEEKVAPAPASEPGKVSAPEPEVSSLLAADVDVRDSSDVGAPGAGPVVSSAEVAAGAVDFDAFLRKTDLPARVNGDIVDLVSGDRFFRAEGFRRNMSHGSLQVSLTAVFGENSYTDKLELHGGRDRERFVRSGAVDLELEEKVLKRDLDRVFRKLRQLQDDMIEERLKDNERPVYVLSSAEREEAVAYLKEPDILERIARDVSDCGIVGEDLNVKAAYLAALTRRFENPLHVIIQSPSAAGKSTLMNGILDLIPDEEKLVLTEISPQALYYMGDDALVHKTIAFAEDGGMSAAEYSLKTLLSDGFLRKATAGKDEETGELRTKIHFMPGPTQCFYTTNQPIITEDLQNRGLVLTVGLDPELTRLIHESQRRGRTLEGLKLKKKRENLIRLHRNIQRALRPVHVINPYANLLTFPSERERTRRDHAKYLTLIESIAFLRQFLRPVERVVMEGEELECVRVTREDIRAANPLAVCLFGASLDELGPITRSFLESLREMVRLRAETEKIEPEDVFFTRRQAREHSKWSETQVRNQIRRLEDFEFVFASKGRQGLNFVYQLAVPSDNFGDERIFAGLIDPDGLPESLPD